MSRVSILVQLQTIDQELDEKSRRLKQVDILLAEDPALLAAQSVLAQAEKDVAILRTQLRTREMDASTLESKIRDVEQHLYGGRVQNPKELEGLEKDLQMHKHQRSDQDDELLRLMEVVEQNQRRVVEKRRELDSLQASRVNQVELLSSERRALADRVGQLKTLRLRIRSELDSDALRTYDRLRQKSARAVATVRRDACGECGVEVPTGLVQRVRSGDELVFCSGCGRILG